MLTKDMVNPKQRLSKIGGFYSLTRPRLWVVYLLMGLSLACVTNTPVAQLSTARPTRTALPTFTNTPIPPTATPVPTPTDTTTPTNTPLVTDTPTLPPDLPTPIDTPIPPTDTPVPPPTNPPAPTAIPPTDTPVPTPTPVPVAVSPLTTPTWTPVPGSPPGRYRPSSVDSEANCAHVGVRGAVRVGPNDDDDPIANVTIQVTGEGDYPGPYFGTSGSDGLYAIVIGEYGYVDEDIEFRAEVFGPGVDTSDEPEWETTEDCHSDDAVQVMNIDWARDDDDDE